MTQINMFRSHKLVIELWLKLVAFLHTTVVSLLNITY